MAHEPFYARCLPGPDEGRAYTLARLIFRLPIVERRWRIAYWHAAHLRPDLTQRAEYLAGLLPRGGEL